MDIINMLEAIRQYHAELGYDTTKMQPSEVIQHFRDQSLALNQEVAELINCAPWKPWRDVLDQPSNIGHAAEEAVDCVFFLVGLLECFGVRSGDFVKAFKAKLAINHKRIQDGYNNKPDERG